MYSRKVLLQIRGSETEKMRSVLVPLLDVLLNGEKRRGEGRPAAPAAGTPCCLQGQGLGRLPPADTSAFCRLIFNDPSSTIAPRACWSSAFGEQHGIVKILGKASPADGVENCSRPGRGSEAELRSDPS